MTLARILLASLLLQLSIYAYSIRWIYTNRGDWELLAVFDLLIFAFLGLVNIGLFIAYWMQRKRRKQPFNPWISIIMVVMVVVTLSTPWIVNWADGPERVDAYGRTIND